MLKCGGVCCVAGSVVERYEYDAYGSPYILEPNFTADPDGKSDYGNPYLFTGRRVDFLDNGSLTLQHNRHRYYDYYTGRWTTQDPLDHVDGMNLYEYVQSNPIAFLDPWGFGVYAIGSTLPPRPAEGPGAGPYASEIPCFGDWTLWSFYFWAAGIVSGTVPHASAHLEHFLNNSGDEYTVDVADMVSESITAKRHFYKEINDALRAAEETPCSMTSFTLLSNWTSRSIAFKESADWNLAVARYYAAGKADVTRVWGTPVCTYQMKFTFNFSDKYDWDRGAVFKTVGPLTLSAEPLGRLHRVGLAQEFWMKGETSTTFTWEKGQRFNTNTGVLLPPPSGGGAGGEW